ncbi:MAG: RagB/SusD family nutrient uptake outer membrane protein [Paludibacter sp.]
MKQITIISTKILALIVLFSTLVSCEKDKDLSFFEKQYPLQSPWQSVNDFENAVIGSYWLLSGNDAAKNPFVNQRLALDASSDGLYWNANFQGDGQCAEIYNRNNEVNISYIDNAFANNYMTIGTATDAINFLETGENNNPYPFDINKAQVPRLEGELRFVRAYTWWMLSTLYLPPYQKGAANNDKVIPWLEKIPNGFEEAIKGQLATTQQIYDVMVSDLEKAITILPEKYDATKHHASYKYGRANKYAAMALLSRVYLQMNEFDKAKKLCDDIISYAETSNYYTLTGDPINAFNTNTGVEGGGTEVIWFYLQYDGDGVGSWKNQWVAERFSRSRRTGDNHSGRALSCSDYFLETVGWQNPTTKEETAEALADKRYKQLYHRYLPSTSKPSGYATPDDGIYETQFTTNRAYVWGDKYYKATSNRLKTNIPMIRLSEIYLTRAILRLKAVDAVGAAADINKVRARAGLTALAAVTENDIHNERWKELNFEGDRVYYLRALHIDIPNGDRGAGVQTWNSPKWQWKVLARETELNEAYK